MAFTMSLASLPAFEIGLNALAAVLDKGAAHMVAKKADVAVLLNWRLAPDMFPLTRQVQIACDQVKNGAARLAGVEPPKFEDNETTLDDVKARIAKTLAFVKTLDKAAIDGASERDIVFPLGPTKKGQMKGADYLTHFVLPNFYFHLTAAYAIVRMSGADVGKLDFLGTMPIKIVEDLLQMRPEDKYSQIFEHLNLASVMQALGKKSSRGRPEELNIPAMVYSLLIAKMDGIEFVSALVRRLKSSEEFRIQCRFTGSNRIPSEASYSRLIHELQQNGLLEKLQDRLVLSAMEEGFVTGTHIAVDSSIVEAWDCQYRESASKRRAARRSKKQSVAPTAEQLQLDAVASQTPPVRERPKKPVFGPGRISAEEKERRRKKLEAYEASLEPFEKKIEDMLSYTYEELLAALPRQAARCDKKNSKGRLTSWYGFKANVLVDTDRQYILSGVFSSANPNDQRMAILLLKGLPLKFPSLRVKHVLGDKGYDSKAVYQLVRSLGAYPVIDMIHHTEPPEGMNKDYNPVCKEGHVYRYDSFDPGYETLRYTRPNECKDCPFAESGCQKVFKIRIETDLRKHTYPARGSESFKNLYKKRTAVERVFAYLKEYFGMQRTRHRGVRASVDFQLSTLAYNLSKFALDKLNKQLNQSQQVA